MSSSGSKPGAAKVELWAAPEVGKAAGAQKSMATVSGLADLQAEAYKEAFAQGLDEGRAAGRAEVRAQVERLDGMFYDLAKPFKELDDEVERELLTLAMALARQIVRRELKIHPDEIVAVIRETVALLPMTARDIRVHLNPEDAKLVRSRMVEAGSDRSWNIAEDPLVSRGGCRVSSENSTIDATLEQRLGAAIAGALGDWRVSDAQEGE